MYKLSELEVISEGVQRIVGALQDCHEFFLINRLVAKLRSACRCLKGGYYIESFIDSTLLVEVFQPQTYSLPIEKAPTFNVFFDLRAVNII